MGGLFYQLKSVWKDKFCMMSFFLPIVVAFALNLIGGIDLSSVAEFHFGVESFPVLSSNSHKKKQPNTSHPYLNA